jgi:hypothetical protein
MKSFFYALKSVYGPQKSGSDPILDASGATLLTDRDQILKRWAEHFDGVLNRPSSINEEAINQLPQVAVNTSLDDLPSFEETTKAIDLARTQYQPKSTKLAVHVW